MIKRIKIRDFKSIGEIDLELDPVTVLVGRSGSGKSNLVQAIRFLRNLLFDLALASHNEFGWERIVPVGKQNPQTSIDVTFSVPGEERDYRYVVAFGLQRSIKAFQGSNTPLILRQEQLSLGEEMIFSRGRDPTAGAWSWKKAPNVTPVPSQAETPRLGSFPSLQQVVFAYAALSTGIGYYHFPSSTLVASRRPQPVEQMPKHFTGLDDNATNYRDVMRSIIQDFHRPLIRKSLFATLQSVNPSIESIELDSLTTPTKASIAHKAADRIFALSLEQESDGFRRFYAHLLALYQIPSKLLLVFEEPENAIFPGALSVLAEEFRAAPCEDRGQVVLTTHSPILLDSFDVENVRVVEMHHGQTVVGKISKTQRQSVKDQILTTGELLTVDTARLDEEEAEAQPA